MTFLKVMGFSLFVLLAYTAFANILPQVQGDPPAEEKIDHAALDMTAMIALGERLFTGRGGCKLCHNDLGRAPDLLQIDLAKVFPKHIADARYNGAAKGLQGAKAIESYLLESMLEPSKYVVAGFGKKGSNDTISQMPKVDAAPVSLSKVEIDALTAFLQDRAGVTPTVALPSAQEAPPAPAAGSAEDEDGPASTPVAAIEKFGCAACHDLEGSKADAGPKLNGIAKRMSDQKLLEAIIDPNAEIAKGFEKDMMPLDFSEQMRVSELNMIISYLKKLPE